MLSVKLANDLEHKCGHRYQISASVVCNRGIRGYTRVLVDRGRLRSFRPNVTGMIAYRDDAPWATYSPHDMTEPGGVENAGVRLLQSVMNRWKFETPTSKLELLYSSPVLPKAHLPRRTRVVSPLTVLPVPVSFGGQTTGSFNGLGESSIGHQASLIVW